MECLPSYVDDLYLQHPGIKGMHWGVRKYENYDGTLTPAGRKRYAKLASKYDKRSSKSLKKAAVKVLSVLQQFLLLERIHICIKQLLILLV